MPDIHIHREHDLGFAQARKIAFSWAEQAEAKFDMECTYEEGDTEDTLYFTRSGVKGTLLVDARQFEMKAQLGFLFGAFKDRIEAEIGEQLDALLSAPKPAAKKAKAAKTPAPAPAHAADKKPAKASAAKPAVKAKKA
ncbi:polyhydroxyalkanoic acid system family protein [Acidovorax sp.]|uniref:polyhydroxyalkanoic acid system family protein n=1 Tax=Acidovorax sp. TaxID=1872122 RepID=UPI00391C9D7D